MKYKDILEDILAGKLVRYNSDCKWMRMKESGMWDNDHHNLDFAIEREVYDLDTWEVKLEEIYVWGATNDNGNSCIHTTHPEKIHDYWLSGNAITLSEKGVFPADKPQKYKLIPVEEDHDAGPEEIRIVVESVDKPRGHTPAIGAFVVSGAVEVHQKYKLIPIDEEPKVYKYKLTSEIEEK